MPDQAPAPIVFSFPHGIDNRDRETAVPPTALRGCDNLDVTRDGGLLSRKGTRLVSAGDCHSLWTHPSHRFLLLVKDGQLSRVDPDETCVALAPTVGNVSYALMNDDVFWTDGSSIGQVTAKGETGVWGMPSPPLPLVTATGVGGLAAGIYQVAMSAVAPNGLESGVSGTVRIEVAEGGGIEVTTPNATGVAFAFYRTPVNGASEELRFYGQYPPGQTALLGVGNLGKRLESLYAVRPLPGQCLMAHKGRLWGASGKVVWFTSERSPHWLFPSVGYYQFESEVAVVGATEDGLFVGLYDRVYYLQGADPYQMTQRPVSSVGAVKGSGLEIPYDLFVGQNSFPSRQCAWWDTEGFLCVGKPGGIVMRPTQDRYSAGLATHGVMAYRRHEGMRQLVTGLSVQDGGGLHATDTAINAVFANGVVLNP